MKRIVIFGFLFIVINNCLGQDKTKVFFNKWSSKLPDYKVLLNVIVGSVNLDNYNLDDYQVTKIFKNIDYNQDGNSDLIIFITMDFRKRADTDVGKISNKNYRLLLFCNNMGSGNSFNTNMIVYKILNQGTDGVYNSDLEIKSDKNLLVFQEDGEQIETTWATQLIFSLERGKEMRLIEANSYTCEITPKETILKKPVNKLLIKDTKYIKDVSYYDYFPFGFTDFFPEN